MSNTESDSGSLHLSDLDGSDQGNTTYLDESFSFDNPLNISDIIDDNSELHYLPNLNNDDNESMGSLHLSDLELSNLNNSDEDGETDTEESYGGKKKTKKAKKSKTTKKSKKNKKTNKHKKTKKSKKNKKTKKTKKSKKIKKAKKTKKSKTVKRSKKGGYTHEEEQRLLEVKKDVKNLEKAVENKNKGKYLNPFDTKEGYYIDQRDQLAITQRQQRLKDELAMAATEMEGDGELITFGGKKHKLKKNKK